MLLDIVVIVLRETLEASILIAVLLSVSQNQGIKFDWVPMSILTGFVGAVIYGSSLGVISEWFDYAGQEVVNAGIQLEIYLLICILISLQWYQQQSSKGLVRFLMYLIVCAALVREGGELFVFYSGFLQKEDVMLRALTSGFVGLAVGLSAGALVYYALVVRRQSKVNLLHTIVLTLVAAGMVVQATQLLMQVDWISSGEPLWDSNWLISEASVFGQVIYAIFGYEATPSVIEVSAYGLSIIGVIVIVMLAYQFRNKHETFLQST